MIKHGWKYCVCLLYCFLCIHYAGITAEQDIRRNEADSLKQKLKESLPDSSRVVVLSGLARHYSMLNTTMALKYANEGIAICEQRKSNIPLSLKGDLLITTGIIYHMMLDYSKALFYYFQSLRIWEEGNLTKKAYRYNIARCYNNIASCYGNLKQYELAKKYFLVALPLMDPKDLHTCYNNLGNIAGTQNNLYEAISYYKKSIEAEEDKYAYANLGRIYTQLNNLKLAEYYYKRGMDLSRGDIYSLTSYYQGLGRLYLKTNLFQKAEAHLLKAKELAETSGVNVSCEDIYENLVQMYEAQNDYKRANIYHQMLHNIRDSVYKESTMKQISEMQAKYESDKKDKELQIAEVKSSREQLLRTILITAFIPVIVITIILYRNVRLKRKMNRILGRYNRQLTHENISARYEVLKSKTNPHFLFNSLNILSAIIVDNPEQAVEYVERFSTFYRKILKTGENVLISLHEEMQIVNNYLYLQKMRFEDNLIVDVNISAEQHHVFVPPLAVQMLVENAIKHNTITGSRNLYIDINADNFFITVKNNLQRKPESVQSTSTGHKSIIDRYALITDVQPLFKETETTYIAQLPLLTSENKIKYELETV